VSKFNKFLLKSIRMYTKKAAPSLLMSALMIITLALTIVFLPHLTFAATLTGIALYIVSLFPKLWEVIKDKDRTLIVINSLTIVIFSVVYCQLAGTFGEYLAYGTWENQPTINDWPRLVGALAIIAGFYAILILFFSIQTARFEVKCDKSHSLNPYLKFM
jgi:hypothetical protein